MTNTTSTLHDDEPTIDQRELLLALKQAHGATRDELAKLIGCERRRLDTWLLPAGSSGRRTMPELERHGVEVQLKNHAKEQQWIAEGRLSRREGFDGTIICPVSGVVYPLPYRQTNHEVVLEARTVNGELQHHYVLSDKDAIDYGFDPVGLESIFACMPGYRKATSEYVEAMNHPQDRGWFSMLHVENQDEAEGIYLNHCAKPDYGYAACPHWIHTRHGLFIGQWHDPQESPAFNGHMVFATRYVKASPWDAKDTDFAFLVVDPAGVVHSDDDYYARLSDYSGEQPLTAEEDEALRRFMEEHGSAADASRAANA